MAALAVGSPHPRGPHLHRFLISISNPAARLAERGVCRVLARQCGVILASLAQQWRYPMPESDARPDIVIVMTDEERAILPYEVSRRARMAAANAFTGRAWFRENSVSFSPLHRLLACAPNPAADYLHRAVSWLARCDSDRRDRQSPTTPGCALAPPTRSADIGQLVPGRGLRHAFDGNGTSPTDLRQVWPRLGGQRRHGKSRRASAVERYLDADPLAPYGFSGWVGPEPHGAPLANSGFRRDPLIASGW